MTDPFVGPVPRSIEGVSKQFWDWLNKIRNGRISDLRFRRLHFYALNEDPPDPPAGQAVMWLSDGTGTGTEGQIVIKDTDSGGTTNTRTI